jgi:ABC-type Mn2+/Zn2+ transport system ATPase subunit
MPVPKPSIYLIAGCNGAGKPTFAKEFLPSNGIIREFPPKRNDNNN